MKTIKFKFIALLVVLTGIGTACSVDESENYCFTSAFIALTDVTGPTTTTVNTPITLNVSIKPGNKCGKFNKFSETTSFPKEIKLQVDYEGCSCPATDDVVIAPYIFTATTPGTYVLKFIKATPDAPIERTITVTE